MRAMTPDMSAALSGGATTLARCWRLTRRDGRVFGFTDHDCDLAFAGVVFKAATGLDAAQAENAVGFAVGGGDVAGAFIDDGVLESDLERGLYDAASVEIWLVDWSDSARRVLLDVATIGEVRRSEFAFVAEMRSLAHAFDQERGRQFQRGCSADLGDARCGVALNGAAFSTWGVIAVVEACGDLLVDLAEPFESGFFSRGVAQLGANGESGPSLAIKAHDRAGMRHRLTLWAHAGGAAPQMSVRLFAGCDKSPETCRGKFDNIVNFRGFPHLPGNDVVMAYPKAGAPMDGGSLFR